MICYCDDCQSFARFLGTPEIMDGRGGTDIFQVPPAKVRITQGFDAVQCMRLSAKGMVRWYAGCCRTPIGNTVSGRVPFVGVIHSFRAREGNSPPPDDMLAKPVGIWGRFAIGGAPPGVYDKGPVSVIARFALNIGKWWLTGQGKPSPFFDAKTGKPCVEPKVLTPAERDALRASSAPLPKR